jgi:hypothetical protein
MLFGCSSYSDDDDEPFQLIVLKLIPYFLVNLECYSKFFS